MATGFGDTISASPVDKYFTNIAGNVIFARCTVANIPTGAGYAVGCLLQATDTGYNYINTGSITAASFTQLDAGTAFSLPTSATDATTTTGTSLSLTANSVTTGAGEVLSVTGLTTGTGITITSGTALTTGQLINLNMGAATAGTGLQVTSTGIYVTGSNGLISVTANAATTATGLIQASGTGITTGSVVAFTGGAGIQNNGAVLQLTASTTAGSILRINNSGVYAGTSGLISLTNSQATTGTIVVISNTGLTTGTSLAITAAAATLTTGFYVKFSDGAANVFTVGANGHITSNQTTAPVVTMTTQAGITAGTIVATSSDTCGSWTSTGTSTGGTIYLITFNKTYTVAPKAVLIAPVNANAAAPNTQAFVSTITATSFSVTIPAGGTYAATPSYQYMVIA